jgi:hypothetical protein
MAEQIEIIIEKSVANAAMKVLANRGWSIQTHIEKLSGVEVDGESAKVALVWHISYHFWGQEKTEKEYISALCEVIYELVEDKSLMQLASFERDLREQGYEN